MWSSTFCRIEPGTSIGYFISTTTSLDFTEKVPLIPIFETSPERSACVLPVVELELLGDPLHHLVDLLEDLVVLRGR